MIFALFDLSDILSGLKRTMTSSGEYVSDEPKEDGDNCSSPDLTPAGVIVGVEVTVGVGAVVVIWVGITVVCVFGSVDVGVG
jgi:hypothetical protein